MFCCFVDDKVIEKDKAILKFVDKDKAIHRFIDKLIDKDRIKVKDKFIDKLTEMVIESYDHLLH